MGGYLAYTEYKDCGVKWLGKIPAHWEVWKATHGFRRIGSGTTPKSDKFLYYDGDTPWITTSELRETVITDTSQKVTKEALEDYSALRLYKEGSVAIAMYGATIGRLGILGIAAAVNQACCVFAEPSVFDSKFFYYWLWMCRPILISVSTGGGQPNLSQDDLKQLRIPIPSLPEQRSIARFLDYKTAQIDALIAKKETLLKKLAEKRTALISQAVTKGCDRAVPMKDSGVEWLGEIPAHYELKRLKFVMSHIVDTEHKTAPYDENGAFLVVRTANVRNGKLLLENAKFANEETYKAWTFREIPEPGDILFTREAPAGEACLVPDIPTLCLGQRMVLFKFDRKKYDGYFLLQAIYSGIADEFIKSLSLGSTVSHFNMSDIGSIPLILPPYEEQKRISYWLSNQVSFYDNQIEKVELGIKHLKEYRTALITNAVTGKIDVRDVIPELEPLEVA
jgi:type I restriction enzyme, S subunit